MGKLGYSRGEVLSLLQEEKEDANGDSGL
jgi:hypothetical protein